MAARRKPEGAPSPEAAAPSKRRETREEEGKRLNNELLSEKVRNARLANNSTESSHLREHSVAGESHFNRRREAGTSEAESKATGARQKAAHENQMARHAENSAAAAHHAQHELHRHQATMHQHEQAAAAQKHEHTASAEQRAAESHQVNMATARQKLHASARAHKRAAVTGIAHALFGGSGGSAKSAMQRQVGGGH